MEPPIIESLTNLGVLFLEEFFKSLAGLQDS